MMPDEARVALSRFSRRDFLKSSGALIVSFSIAGRRGRRRYWADPLRVRLR